MNDRQLRHIVSGLGGKVHGVPREDGFDITVASEVMVILCLSVSLDDMRQRLGNIVIGSNYEGSPVTAAQLNAQGAMTAYSDTLSTYLLNDDSVRVKALITGIP